VEGHVSESPVLWVLVVTVLGGFLFYVLRLALQQSITTSIKLAADKQLEELKSELTSRIEGIRHEYQLTQLQTSLLFEYKRTALGELMGRIAEVKREWFNSTHEPYEGITGPVPNEQYRKLLDTYYQHLLFLDRDCLAAMDLVFDALRDSMPFDDGAGKLHPRDCDAAYNRLEYLQPRIAEVFQEKLGFSGRRRGKEQLALLGSILLLNHYHFSDIGLPVKGSLKIKSQDWPADAVAKAEENKEELLHKLREFRDYLRKGHGFFHDAITNISRYLGILAAETDEWQ